MNLPSPSSIVGDLRLTCGYCHKGNEGDALLFDYVRCRHCNGTGKNEVSTPNERAFAKEAARAMAEAIGDWVAEQAKEAREMQKNAPNEEMRQYRMGEKDQAIFTLDAIGEALKGDSNE
jgi:2-polyprenyl-3-methyl-5-hydroxy-6-metoxy-1,4-benzoquinol methylase